MTRNEYSLSSSTPAPISITRLTADATSATSSATPKDETCRSPPVMLSAAISIRASSTSTARNPVISVNGSRSAATSGGRIAFSSEITAAAIRALQKFLTSAPGTIQVATSSAMADTIHCSTRCGARIRGCSACQVGSCA